MPLQRYLGLAEGDAGSHLQLSPHHENEGVLLTLRSQKRKSQQVGMALHRITHLLFVKSS